MISIRRRFPADSALDRGKAVKKSLRNDKDREKMMVSNVMILDEFVKEIIACMQTQNMFRE